MVCINLCLKAIRIRLSDFVVFVSVFVFLNNENFTKLLIFRVEIQYVHFFYAKFYQNQNLSYTFSKWPPFTYYVKLTIQY